jgi:NAD(P)-dependent dehydrogenase (short-subunit alcohol dehydrogenase family)
MAGIVFFWRKIMTLSGKTALITGAAGDLGNEMALQLAQAGADVVLWDVKPASEATQRIQRVAASNQRVEYQQVDVSDRAAVDAAMDAALAMMGGIDIVCSNAGIVESSPFLEISEQNWRRHLEINLTGCFNVGQAAALRMVERGIAGRIIFTSSWVAQIPWPEITS